jgi:hypothetical protein
VLLVRASEPLDAGTAGPTGAERQPEGKTEWKPEWKTAHTTLDVAGDHFTLLEAHARTTADAVREWLGAVTG